MNTLRIHLKGKKILDIEQAEITPERNDHLSAEITHEGKSLTDRAQGLGRMIAQDLVRDEVPTGEYGVEDNPGTRRR